MFHLSFDRMSLSPQYYCYPTGRIICLSTSVYCQQNA